MDLFTFGLIIALLVFIAFCVREYFIHRETLEEKEEKATGKKQNIGSMFSMLDIAIWDLGNLREELKKKGVQDAQLEPIKTRIDRLTWIKNNQGVAEFAIPYVEPLLKGVLKWFK